MEALINVVALLHVATVGASDLTALSRGVELADGLTRRVVIRQLISSPSARSVMWRRGGKIPRGSTWAARVRLPASTGAAVLHGSGRPFPCG